MGDIRCGIPCDSDRVGERWQRDFRGRNRQSDPCEFTLQVTAFSPICKGFLELTKSHGCFEQLYDLHRRKITYTLSAHSDTITSLRLSPSGSYLLSLSLDSSLKIWDVRPFAVASTTSSDGSGDDPTAQRLSQTLSGALASNESLLIRASWSRDGKRITSGSGDRTCVVWDVESSRILYKLPGHRGTCTAAALHPTEPIGECSMWTAVLDSHTTARSLMLITD